jgi:MerR family redox-sensitive transcriptional activator SoxR
MMVEQLLSIGEVAERSGLAASAVRFYEKAGLVRAQRTPGNQRLFRRDVLRRLAFIRIAQKVGLTLEEIVEALDELPNEKAPNALEWKKLSRGWRQRIDERIEILEALRGGLSDCIGCGCLSLRTCTLANRDDAAARSGSGPRYLGEI